MKRKDGFTLVELLTVLIILGIVLLIAVPNVISVLEKSKVSTYVQDAQQMITLAEYKIIKDTSIDITTTKTFLLKELDTSEIKQGPEGWDYNLDKSTVTVKKTGQKYEYTVFICEDNGVKSKSLGPITRENLDKEDVKKEVKVIDTGNDKDKNKTLCS